LTFVSIILVKRQTSTLKQFNLHCNIFNCHPICQSK